MERDSPPRGRRAAGAARRGLILGRPSRSEGCTALLAFGSRRRTHYAPCGRFVRTTAAKMMTKCAARTDPCGPLLGAPEIAPTGLCLPRSWVFGVRYSGPRRPHANPVAGSGRRCVRRSGIKGEPAGRRTAAEPNAPSAWSRTTPPVSRVSCFRDRATTSALGREQPFATGNPIHHGSFGDHRSN